MLSDILIPLRTQPVPETSETADALMRLASSFATHVTLSPLEVTAPKRRDQWSGAFMGLAQISADIQRASQQTSRDLVTSVHQPRALEVLVNPLFVGLGEMPMAITSAARHHDMTMIAFTDADTNTAMAEAAMFGTGRPAMLLPAVIAATERPFSRIAVAWDGSSAASRALYDAMPLLVAADEVMVMSAPGDKRIDRSDVSGLTDYLLRHGIAMRFVQVDIETLDIGLALQHRARSEGAGLLVMGAYGHSRFQQFILGGATRHVLDNLQLPVMMSHS